MENFKEKYILIHPDDNILIVIESLPEGEKIIVNNQVIIMDKPILLGHKIARRQIYKGEKIIKYGVAIGSATQDIGIGMHVHVHNIKSDYIPTYVIDKEKRDGK